jgi:hypothetical protein
MYVLQLRLSKEYLNILSPSYRANKVEKPIWQQKSCSVPQCSLGDWNKKKKAYALLKFQQLGSGLCALREFNRYIN